MSFESLLPLGWNPSFEADLLNSELKVDESLARVIQVERGFFRLAFALDKFVLAEVSGKMRHESKGPEDIPVIGDFVKARVSPDGEKAQVTRILHRKSCLKRIAPGKTAQSQIFAANVDFVFIMSSANEDFNLRRLERYLAMVWDSGAEPVVILSKSDLAENIQDYMSEIEKISFHSAVIAISAKSGEGIEKLTPYLAAGKTSVVVGSSGVGKSTLINKLLGEEKIFTQDIRDDDDRGRHTTTSRSLHVLPSGALLIDTPGIRQLQLTASETGISQSFQDIEDLATKCKFSDCQHNEEPGCEVQKALTEQNLEPVRWANYQKLQREQKSLEIRKDPAKMAEQKSKWKQIHKGLRQKYKITGKK